MNSKNSQREVGLHAYKLTNLEEGLTGPAKLASWVKHLSQHPALLWTKVSDNLFSKFLSVHNLLNSPCHAWLQSGILSFPSQRGPNHTGANSANQRISACGSEVGLPHVPHAERPPGLPLTVLFFKSPSQSIQGGLTPERRWWDARGTETGLY